MDPFDRELLASLGHRLEVWNSAITTQGTLSERRDALLGELVQQVIEAERSTLEIVRVDLPELKADVERAEAFRGTEADFATLCAERAAYYAEVRALYIKTVLQKPEEPGPGVG